MPRKKKNNSKKKKNYSYEEKYNYHLDRVLNKKGNMYQSNYSRGWLAASGSSYYGGEKPLSDVYKKELITEVKDNKLTVSVNKGMLAGAKARELNTSKPVFNAKKK